MKIGHWWQGGGIVLALLALMAGCQSRGTAHRSIEAQKPIGMLNRPAIDLSRGGAGFPLKTDHPPADAVAMAQALRAAYAERLENGGQVDIRLVGANARRLETMTVDLTGSTVRPDLLSRPGKPTTRPVAVTHVQNLVYLADPLKYQTFSASLRLQADHAELAVFPAGEQLLMSLVDCDQGTARLRIAQDDLRQGLLAAARARLKDNLTFAVQDVELTLASARPSMLVVDVVLHARFLFVPTTIELHGRIDVAGNSILFTELEATGRDPTAVIAAAFIQDKLDDYNRKIGRILKVPGDRVHVTNVAFHVDDHLAIDATFSGRHQHAAKRAE